MLRRFMEATERNDVGALATMMTDDARFSMPEVFDGREVIVRRWLEGGFGTDRMGGLRCVAVWANMQPAVACYRRRPGGTEFRAMALDVLRIAGGMVAEINTFGPDVFPSFGLPAQL